MSNIIATVTEKVAGNLTIVSILAAAFAFLLVAIIAIPMVALQSYADAASLPTTVTIGQTVTAAGGITN